MQIWRPRLTQIGSVEPILCFCLHTRSIRSGVFDAINLTSPYYYTFHLFEKHRALDSAQATFFKVFFIYVQARKISARQK